jgi:creatinine amidohydrolase
MSIENDVGGGARESLRLVAERVAAIPAALEATLRRASLTLPGAPLARRFAVTGGGLSEGPARFLVALLADELGLRARFVSLSQFAARDPGLDGETVILVSQGLAPNARLPLLHQARYAALVILTSVIPDDAAPAGSPRRLLAQARARGALVETLPPTDEPGLLIRVIGGATAALAGARMISALGEALGRAPLDVTAVPAAYAAALARPRPRLAVDGSIAPVALIASGRYTDYAFAQRWKLLEGLRLPDPPIWDVLGFAHGPFQEVHDRPFTLVALERGLPHEAALLDRLARLLRSHHRLLRLPSSLPGPLAWFEHDAQVNGLVVDGLTDRPLDLTRWPGFGEDGPIYDVDSLV